MKAERYRAYSEYMHACMKDSAHDVGHIFRVLDAALVLAQAERHVNMEVLIAAALLHDVGREEQFRTGESHALISARMARAFLEELDEDEAFVEQVCACIRTHSFRRNDPPEMIEAKIIYDADKLDVVGLIGIARTLMYQGRSGDPIYSMDEDGTVLQGQEKEASFYSEYTHKLRGMAGRFLTEAGRKMAVRRSEKAAQFVEELRAEAATGESGAGWRILPKTATARQRRVYNVARMVAEGSGNADGSEIVRLVMQGGAEAGHGLAGRAVMDAEMLDDLGALGIAQKLIAIGKAGERMDGLLGVWPDPELYTKQARGMAKVRRETAMAFLDGLRVEMTEYGAEAGKASGKMMR